MRSPAAQASERRAGIAVLLAFLGISFVFSGQIPPFRNPNELSRIEAVYAMVESGTLAIDDAIRRFGDHEDKALFEGRLFSNKAPGLALAAAPVYRLVRMVYPRPASPFDAVWLVVRVLVVTTVCALALFLFWRRLSERGAPAAALVLAGLALGSPFLFYARTLFSHAWTASLVFLSLELIRRGEALAASRRVRFYLWAAGVLAGWAVISEYPVAVLAAVLLLRAGSRRSWTRMASFALGAALPGAVLLAYNAACFGSPFSLSSAHEAAPEFSRLVGNGLFGFHAPSPIVAFQFLFHPARGLVLYSPFVLWAIPGFLRWRRSGEDAPDRKFCLFGSLLFFVAMCGYPNWHGGWCLESRYLIPLLFPLALAIPHALGTPRSRWAFAAAIGFSIGVQAVSGATWPYFPLELPWTPATGSGWFLARGWIAQAMPPLTALPGLIAAAASTGWVVVALSLGERRPGTIPGSAMAAGLLAFAATLVAMPPPPFSGRLWRAETFAKYSGKARALEDLRRELSTATTPAEKRHAARIREIWRLPP